MDETLAKILNHMMSLSIENQRKDQMIADLQKKLSEKDSDPMQEVPAMINGG